MFNQKMPAGYQNYEKCVKEMKYSLYFLWMLSTIAIGLKPRYVLLVQEDTLLWQ